MDFEVFMVKVKSRASLNAEAIMRAYTLAEAVHHHQKRKSGEPYIIHPVAVANIIFDIGGDGTMICAALLHDTLEDSLDPEQTEKDIRTQFSKEVYYLVHALSKDGSIDDKTMQQDLFFTQFEEALKTDISVFFIKMADLIHNLDTIGGLRQDKKEIWLTELQQTYIPMLKDYYHKIAPDYHTMYQEMMEKLEQSTTKALN